MNEPIWLKRDWILSLQEELLSRFGGLAGIRDKKMLESALNRPLDQYSYREPSLYELAAAYSFGLVKNHPFIDGNKRIAYMAAYSFLGLNGIELNASESDAVLHTLALAASEEEEKAYASWLEKSCS